ncbi:MAG: tetratricopeptide repeat protein [Candidatus Aenigmarchaeota archaeon]|nr:tetratricopeptide repeat protein [Candidatus Aenigmarchaeota archaeon]
MSDLKLKTIQKNIEHLKKEGQEEYGRGQWDAAITSFKAMRELGRQTNDDDAQGFAYYCIAMCYREKAEKGEPRFWNESALTFETSLTFYTLDSPLAKKEKAKILGKLAYVHKTLGFYNRALRNLGEAIEISRGLEDHMRLAELLNDKATMLMESGAYEDAHDIFDENLEVLAKLKEKYDRLTGTEKTELNSISQELARGYNNIGECARVERDFQKAYEYFQKCLEATDQIIPENPKAQAKMHAYLGLGKCYAQTNTSPDEALENSRKARVIAERIGHLKEVASSYKIDALVRENAGDFDEAISTYKKVLMIYEEQIGMVRDRALVLAEMGDTYIKAERYDEARESLSKSRNAFEQMGMATHVAFVDKLKSKVNQ